MLGRKCIYLVLFIQSLHLVNAQQRADTSVARLFALGEFNQFYRQNSIFESVIIRSEGFKDILFVKVKARDIDRLMMCAMGRITDTIGSRNPLWDSIMHIVLDEKYLKRQFKKYYGYDNVTSANLKSIESLFDKSLFINNQFGEECDYVLAFDSSRAYLLKGFGNNQFDQFFNECIKTGKNISENVKVDPLFIKGKFKKLLNNSLKIDEMDLLSFYAFYIEKKKGDYPQCQPCSDMLEIR